MIVPKVIKESSLRVANSMYVSEIIEKTTFVPPLYFTKSVFRKVILSIKKSFLYKRSVRGMSISGSRCMCTVCETHSQLKSLKKMHDIMYYIFLFYRKKNWKICCFEFTLFQAFVILCSLKFVILNAKHSFLPTLQVIVKI